MTKEQVLLCDCGGSFAPDAEGLGAAAPVCSQLCRGQISVAETVLKQAVETGLRVRIACEQEAATFADLAEELGAEDALFTVDLRDRAGWSDQSAAAGPKMAALLADARLGTPATPALTLESEGACLIYGPPDVALEAAQRLDGALSPTIMLTETGGFIPPRQANISVFTGKIENVSGALGRFSVQVDALRELLPHGRGPARFSDPRDGGESVCDVILDLSGGAPLVPAPEKRDGYVRADPRDPAACLRAIMTAAELVGEFEKPLYVRFEESLCAHSRARRSGCDRCLSVCPTGAITPNGDHVSIDPNICAGCGACAAVCPSGAVSYDAPTLDHTLRRMRAMIQAYRTAGGAGARLLIHDADHGADLIALAARFGRGLPADVIPMAVPETGLASHAALAAALAQGFDAAYVLTGPRSDRAALADQIALAQALITGAGLDAARIGLIDETDPDAVMDQLYESSAEPHGRAPVLPMGSGRQVARLAVKGLADNPAGPIALPPGAPYGDVTVNTEACTLCLACVSLCPSGALMDNPDAPQLRFQEDACLQCGICADACPEQAISLTPQMNLSDAALSAVVKNEEEPACCVSCGKAFGVKSTIERIAEKLAGKHWMFTDSDNVRLIQMCDNCRIQAQFGGSATGNPFFMGERRPVRTTEDDLAERGAASKPPKLI